MKKIILYFSLLALICSCSGDSAEIRQLKKEARAGSVESQLILGDRYLNGDGVSENRQEAFKWYKMSAEHGSAHGAYNVGAALFSGDGTQENRDESLRWFVKAGLQNHEEALMALSEEFGSNEINRAVAEIEAQQSQESSAQSETSNDKNVSGEFKRLKAKAEKGDAQAQYMVYMRYKDGEGVAENEEEEEKWLRKAAENGYPDAQWTLGSFYLYNGESEQERYEGINWLRKASAQDDEMSYNILNDFFCEECFQRLSKNNFRGDNIILCAKCKKKIADR